MDLPRFSLAGKVALITGGSRGIGEATALLFAQAGANVAVTSRKLPDLERVADLVRAEGRRAVAIEAHAGRIEGLQGIVDRTIEELGGLDVLVNNAGTSNYAPSMEMGERAWGRRHEPRSEGTVFPEPGSRPLHGRTTAGAQS